MLVRLHLLFEKYLKRQCTAQEVDELVFLLQQAEIEEKLTEPMETLWKSLRNDIQYEVDWDKMYGSIVRSGKHADLVIKRSTSSFRPGNMTIAVVLLLFSASVLFVSYFTSHKPGRENSQVTVHHDSKLGSNHQTIHLPDGSTVILNTGSTLNYPSAFKAGRRDVYLKGEAFFDVQHNPSQPFFVHAGKLVVKVLGTVFNIKSYPLQKNIEVTVTRGKVQVFKEDKTLAILTASQQISFVNTSGNVIITKADTLAVNAWKPAELHFNDITMEEAAQKIEKRFNVMIEFVNPAVKQCRITATFSEEDMKDEVLAVICAVSKADYTINDNKILINGKGCN